MSSSLQNISFLGQVALPLFIIWAIALILSFFRREIEFIWKAFFTLIFFFYVILFYQEIMASYVRLVHDYPYEIRNYIYGIGKAYFFALIILWPLVLLRIYYSASDYLSERIIKTMVMATMFYWAGFSIWLIFHKNISYFLENRFVEWIKL